MNSRLRTWVWSVTLLWVTIEAPAQTEPGLFARAETTVGLHRADYSTIDDPTQTFVGEHLTIGYLTPSSIGVRGDVLVGTFENGTRVLSAAGHTYLNGDWGLVGLSIATIRLEGGITSDLFFVDGCVYEDSLLTTVLAAGYEKKNFGDDLIFAELYLRIYPLQRLLLAPGISYAQSEAKQTRADIIVRADYSAFQFLDWTLGIYAQYGGNLFTKLSGGITFYFDSLDYRERDRTTGPPGVRFK